MKNTTLTIIVLAAMIGTLHAQENKTIKEVSTVKRVVKKEGSQVIVQEIEDVEKTKGSVIVAGNEQENQYFTEDSTKTDAKKVLKDEVTVNKTNEALVAAEKKRQEEELRKSIEASKAAAEATRKKLEQQEKERMQALEENRKKLEKRGKGIVKLQKKKNN